MRGLDARVTLAMARVLAIGTDKSERDGHLFATAEHEALHVGIDDAINGIDTVPAMFADEPSLAERWHAGQARYERGLDKAAWRARCEEMASEASTGCGLSHDYYVARFSFAVRVQLLRIPQYEHAAALEIAREFDYATAAEIEETAIDNAENGYCSHGIELGCCPAGCDYPDDDVDDFDYESYIPLDVLLEAGMQAPCGPTQA